VKCILPAGTSFRNVDLGLVQSVKLLQWGNKSYTVFSSNVQTRLRIRGLNITCAIQGERVEQPVSALLASLLDTASLISNSYTAYESSPHQGLTSLLLKSSNGGTGCWASLLWFTWSSTARVGTSQIYKFIPSLTFQNCYLTFSNTLGDVFVPIYEAKIVYATGKSHTAYLKTAGDYHLSSHRQGHLSSHRQGHLLYDH
jgi:hypothetical protein